MFGMALVSKQELYRQSLQYGLDALQAILDWFLEAFEAIVVLRSNQVYCRGRKRKRACCNAFARRGRLGKVPALSQAPWV